MHKITNWEFSIVENYTLVVQLEDPLASYLEYLVDFGEYFWVFFQNIIITQLDKPCEIPNFIPIPACNRWTLSEYRLCIITIEIHFNE